MSRRRNYAFQGVQFGLWYIFWLGPLVSILSSHIPCTFIVLLLYEVLSLRLTNVIQMHEFSYLLLRPIKVKGHAGVDAFESTSICTFEPAAVPVPAVY